MEVNPDSMLSPWSENLMKVIARITLCFLVGFLGSWQGSLFAQVSDHEGNLSACKNGLGSCNRADLTDAESHNIDVSRTESNRAIIPS